MNSYSIQWLEKLENNWSFNRQTLNAFLVFVQVLSQQIEEKSSISNDVITYKRYNT